MAHKARSQAGCCAEGGMVMLLTADTMHLRYPYVHQKYDLYGATSTYGELSFLMAKHTSHHTNHIFDSRKGKYQSIWLNRMQFH